MKQTAVEWLLEQLEHNILWTDKAKKLAEQTKEMEKEEIMNAYIQGQYDGDTMRDTDAEQYYNETFKKK
jgi:glucose-6-phosphate 1-dehydrogenase